MAGQGPQEGAVVGAETSADLVGRPLAGQGVDGNQSAQGLLDIAALVQADVAGLDVSNLTARSLVSIVRDERGVHSVQEMMEAVQADPEGIRREIAVQLSRMAEHVPHSVVTAAVNGRKRAALEQKLKESGASEEDIAAAMGMEAAI